VAAETNAMSIQKSLVLGGHGLTVLPPIAFADELERGLVSAAPLSDPKITRTIVLALPANRAVGSHVRRAVELLVECARNAVARGSRRAGWEVEARVICRRRGRLLLNR
jgi:DNA-binding transcriptional LysR family regulator